MEGLEISEVNFSELERTVRIDSEFYKAINLSFLNTIIEKKPKSLAEFVNVSDGNHLSISDHFCKDGVPYYRGGDIYNFYIEQTSNPLRIPEEVYNIGNMRRSHLKKGDVLISIVGAIIGNLSLVKTDSKATCSCKLAILRSKSIKPELLAIYLKSKFGQNQVQKFRRGTGQTGLILEDFDQLLIPEFSNAFSILIEQLVSNSYTQLENSQQTYKQAETLLLETLGLKGFEPSKEPVNVKSFNESFGSSGRLDAEYYQPKYDDIEAKILGTKHQKLCDYFNLLSNPSPKNYDDSGTKVIKTKNIRIPSVEIENITDHTNEKSLKVKKDDLLFASMGVGSLGRLSYIDSEIENCTIDGTIKLFRTTELWKNKNIEIPTLLYLTSNIGQEIIYKYVIGSTGIISISKENIENLPIPIFEKSDCTKLTKMVIDSINLKSQSAQLLDLAKIAVEKAIEENEEKAMEYVSTTIKMIEGFHDSSFNQNNHGNQENQANQG